MKSSRVATAGESCKAPHDGVKRVKHKGLLEKMASPGRIT